MAIFRLCKDATAVSIPAIWIANAGAGGLKVSAPIVEWKGDRDDHMTSKLIRPPVLRRLIGGALLGVACAGFAIVAPSASAQDAATLTQLAQLTVQKGFKNISLGDVCDRLHIGTACKVYQLNAAIDLGESRKFGLTAGWQTSLNIVPQRSGTDIVITDHDSHIGYAYLIGADGGLKNVVVGLSSSGDGKNWRWKPGAVNDEITRKFASEKAYWLAQINDIQALPDRKD